MRDIMRPMLLLMLALLAVSAKAVSGVTPGSPMRIGIVGMVHGHVEGDF